jgi:hypothetical protein
MMRKSADTTNSLKIIIIFVFFIMMLAACDKPSRGAKDKKKTVVYKTSPVELVVNTSFENGKIYNSGLCKKRRSSREKPTGWTTKNQLLNDSNGWAMDKARSGKRSLKIENIGGTNASWQGEEIVLNKPAQCINIGIWTYTEKSVAGAVAEIELELSMSSGTVEKKKIKLTLSPCKWRKTENLLFFADNVRKIVPRILFRSRGKVFFDDFSIAIAKPQISYGQNLIQNGDFEEGKPGKGPINWKTQDQKLNSSTGWTTDKVYSGTRSLKIINGGRWGCWNGRYVKLRKPVSNLLLEAWTCSEIKKSPKVYAIILKVSHTDGSSSFFEVKLPASKKWIKIKKVKNFNKEVIGFKPMWCFFYGNGAVWLDRISITPIYL